MTEIPRDGLQSIASAETVSPELLLESRGTPTEIPDSMDYSLVCEDSGSSAASDMAQADSTPLVRSKPPASPQTTRWGSARKRLQGLVHSAAAQNPVRILLEHRRQTAAAVVLICMAVLWNEENTPEVPSSANESGDEITNVESLLSDFDSADSLSQQEPAEPVVPTTSEFQWTIPQSRGEPTADASRLMPSNSSSAVAVYPDDPPASAVSARGNSSIPNTTPERSADSALESGGRRGVRFTGRIQPLN